MTGDTIYRLIADIDLPEFEYLKDGRPVLCLSVPFCCAEAEPFIASFDSRDGWILQGPGSEITHFSTHDPRPICEHVAGEDDQSPEDIIAEVLSYYGWMNDKGGGEPKDYRDMHQFRIICESAGMITALSRAGFRITK